MAKDKVVTGSEIVNDARRYLGIPYVFGGGPANPRAGLDCSGLVERVAFDLGINSCPRTSELQWTWCTHVRQPQTGDLVFFVGSDGEPGNPGHVGIVVSPGTFIEAPHTGTVVQVSSYSANGSGENALVGYGQMKGVTPSGSANLQYTNATSQTTEMEAEAGLGAGIASSLGFVVIFALIAGAIGLGIFILAQ